MKFALNGLVTTSVSIVVEAGSLEEAIAIASAKPVLHSGGCVPGAGWFVDTNQSSEMNLPPREIVQIPVPVVERDEAMEAHEEMMREVLSGMDTNEGSETNQTTAKTLMAGIKAEGLGNAVFHAADDRRYAVCGVEILLGSLDPASEVPAAMRCKRKACQAAFLAAGL